MALHLSPPLDILPLPLRFIDPTRSPTFVFLPLLLDLGSSRGFVACLASAASLFWARPTLSCLASAALPPCSSKRSSRLLLAGGTSPSLAWWRLCPFASDSPGSFVVISLLFAVDVRHPATTIHGGRVPLLGISGDVQGCSLCEVCFSLLAR